MDKFGISGGLITSNSFLSTEERKKSVEINLRAASTGWREAAKEGMLSLYADPIDVLEKYKDTPVVQAMNDRKDVNLLWVRARAIDADVVNANGDYFSEEELLKENDIQGVVMPAYKTFEGCPIYANHKNNDITEAKGMIVYSEWDDNEKAVYVVFFVDEDTYPDIARGIRVAYMKDVSMGCFPAGTQILTDSGYQLIENVNTENKLIDINGNFTDIVNKQIKIYNDNLVNVKISGGLEISATRDHPFLIFTKESWDSRKKRIRPVVDGKKTSNYVYREIEPVYIDAKNLKIGDRVLSPIGGIEIEIPDVNPARAKVLGYFLAEGSYLKRKGKYVGLQFNFAFDEKDSLAQETIDIIQSEWGITARKCLRKNKQLCIVTVNNQSFANWLNNYVGEYSNGKSLHKNILFAPIEIQKNLIGAWISGDGGLHRLKGKSDSISVVTISRQLALQVGHIFNRLGISHNKRGSINTKSMSFTKALSLPTKIVGEDGRQLAYYFDIPSCYCQKISDYTIFKNDNFSTKIKNHNDCQGYIAREITEIQRSKHNGLVFNFETSTSNYLVSDISVHNCTVALGECSECGNKAATEADYCKHMKEYKGKNVPGKSHKAYEKNYGIKFIELSVVGDGAFEKCSIEEIYDIDEILQKALSVEKKAQALHSSIMVAAAMPPEDRSAKLEYENQLRMISDLTRSAMSIVANPKVVTAQSAGTLVGGSLMAADGANQNTTVAGIIQYLGIDARSGLNILDMLNLALNFLEVAVMNLFARKDNVDLTHVGKITKAMADLQSTMQDMIDDGVDSGGGGTGSNVPFNQGQIQQQPAGSAQQQQPQAVPEFMPLHGGVGRSVSPMIMPGAPPPSMPGFFGASTDADSTRTASDLFIRWAGENENDESGRLVLASTQKNVEIPVTKNGPNQKFSRLGENIMALGNVLGVTEATRVSKTNDANQRTVIDANQSDEHKKKASTKAMGVTEKMSNIFNKLANKMKMKQAATASCDLNFRDEDKGNLIVLSTDKGVSAFHNQRVAEWYTPFLTEDQINNLTTEDGTLKVGSELLEDFGRQVEARISSGREVVADWKPLEEGNVVYEKRLESLRTNKYDQIGEVREKELADAGDYSRKGPDNRVQEKQLEGDGYLSHRRDPIGTIKENELEEDAGLYRRRLDQDDLGTVKEKLLTDARHGNPSAVIEKQLDDVRKNYGPGEPNLVVEATVNALGKAVVAAQVTPEEVVQAVSKLVEANAEELIATAALGSDYRSVIAARYDYHKKNFVLPVNSAILNELGKIVGKTASTRDIADALSVIASESSNAIKTINASAKSSMGENSYFAASVLEETISPKDRMRAGLAAIASKNEETIILTDNIKAALYALAMSSQETKSHPKEVVSAVQDADDKTLFAQVELARSVDAVKNRQTLRNRANFYGARVASTKDVYASVVGMLADYADTHRISTKAIVTAAKRVSENPTVAENLIVKVIEGRSSIAATVTEDKTQKREIHCTLDELGGLDPKSDDFDSGLRSKAMDILTSAGYQVDPNSFALTNVTVNDNSVTASIETHISKTFQASGAAPTDLASTSEVDMAPEGMEPSVIDDGTTITTAGARKLIKAKRLSILSRFAQGMPPGMGGAAAGAAGAGMGGGGGQGLDLGGSGAADGLGMSALTVPTAAGGDPTDEDPDQDAIAEPGKKQPWGTVCPRCGSKEVDVANGEGNCKSCNAQLEFELTVHVKPSNDSDKKDEGSESGAEGESGMPPLGPDTGLGAATAPAPGGAPGGGAGAPGAGAPPPIMATTKWLEDADVFVRFAQVQGNRDLVKALPVGFICPSCGNRYAKKVTENTFCYECGTCSISSVKVAVDKSGKEIPGKVEVSITAAI